MIKQSKIGKRELIFACIAILMLLIFGIREILFFDITQEKEGLTYEEKQKLVSERIRSEKNFSELRDRCTFSSRSEAIEFFQKYPNTEKAIKHYLHTKMMLQEEKSKSLDQKNMVIELPFLKQQENETCQEALYRQKIYEKHEISTCLAEAKKWEKEIERVTNPKYLTISSEEIKIKESKWLSDSEKEIYLKELEEIIGYKVEKIKQKRK